MTEFIKESLHFSTPANTRKERLDKFLTTHLAGMGYSRERVKELIKTGCVQVEDTICTSAKQALNAESSVVVCLPDVSATVSAEEGILPVLYRDAALVLVNKPADLTVHPCPSCPEGTLVNRLLHHFPELAKLEGSRPGIVHRLDKDTTGLLIVALTEHARLTLSEEFAGRNIYKEYLALVHNVPAQTQGTIDAPIDRHPTQKTKMSVMPKGREAKSQYTVLYAAPDKSFSLLAVRIFTGRTHQIRVHLHHIGHPILGDALYKIQGTSSELTRPMLHAWRLCFPHPGPQECIEAGHVTPGALLRRHNKEVAAVCPPPHDFIQALHHLLTPFMPVVITGMPGCGKSTLLRHLAQLGHPTISADAIVAALGKPGADGTKLMTARFGDTFIVDDPASPFHKGINKPALAQAMMNDADLRHEVEMLLHPLVYSAIEQFFVEQKKQGYSMVFAEIPLFFESKPVQDPRHYDSRKHQEPLHLEAPFVIGVNAPFVSRRERLLHKRHWDEHTIATIESWQWDEAKKMKACAMVVDNTDDAITETQWQTKTEALITALENKRTAKNTALFARLETLWQTLPATDCLSQKTEPEK